MINFEQVNYSRIMINGKLHKITYEKCDNLVVVKQIVKAIITMLSNGKIAIYDGLKDFRVFEICNTSHKINILTDMCKLNGIVVNIISVDNENDKDFMGEL